MARGIFVFYRPSIFIAPGRGPQARWPTDIMRALSYHGGECFGNGWAGCRTQDFAGRETPAAV